MAFTEQVSWLQKPFEGWVVNTAFSLENTQVISDLTREIEREYGEKVFVMPNKSLHITLLDWIAPLVDYEGQDKKALFSRLKSTYDSALSDILSNFAPITVRFTELKVYPSTIILLGHDEGQFQAIRDQFIDTIELLPNTKKPPTIIHSSLARFRDAIPLAEVEEFISQKNVDITQQVDNFRLVHTTAEPMLEFEILKKYALGSK